MPTVERIDHIPSHVSPPADGIVYCQVNRQFFRVPCGHYTGEAIRKWHDPTIGGDRDLWRIAPLGASDEQVGEVDVVLFDRSGLRFFDAPRHINASVSEPTERTQPMKTGDLNDAKRWADVPVALRSVLNALPADPRDLLTDEDKAELSKALANIATTRRRAWAKGQHLNVGN